MARANEPSKSTSVGTFTSLMPVKVGKGRARHVELNRLKAVLVFPAGFAHDAVLADAQAVGLVEADGGRVGPLHRPHVEGLPVATAPRRAGGGRASAPAPRKRWSPPLEA